jgi:hypothetical protein
MKPCPNCENVGWYARQVSDDEYEQEQCEFCYTVEDSVFNVVTKLQSTITAQEDVIKRLKEDSEIWYEQAANPCSDYQTLCECDRIHTQLMNELGEK